MGYRIKLQNFEGPLDLLLFLIRKNEVDIYDIPIALITKQYLEYVSLMQQLDLEVASEFILMAATLIRIKVRMLLPRPEVVEEEMEEADPRQELVERLLEYRKFKEIAHVLETREQRQRLLFPRRVPEQELVQLDEAEPRFGQVSLFDLLAAFHESIRRFENQPVHTVTAPAVSVDDQIRFILELLREKAQLSFSELMQLVHVRTRSVLIATFLAILELVRRKEIVVKQPKPFAEIWIFNPEAQN